MRDELLPCPFCGGEAKVIKWFPNFNPFYTVACFNNDIDCDKIVKADSKQQAIKAWNARSNQNDE